MPIFPTGVFSATNPTPTTTRASGTTGPAEQVAALNGEVEAIETFLGASGANVQGSGPLEANLAAGGFKITGLANGTVATDAATFGQVQTTEAALNPALQYSDLLGWTFDSVSAHDQISVEAAATLELLRIPLPTTETITNILLVGVGLGLVLTHSYVALYKSNGVLIGQSADQSAVWGAGGSLYSVQTIALAGGPHVCTPLAANDFVWAAIYVGTSTGTLPAFSGAAASIPFGYIPAQPRSRYGRYPLADTAALTNLTLANLQNTGNGTFWMGIS
jgi:hypothetical protein